MSQKSLNETSFLKLLQKIQSEFVPDFVTQEAADLETYGKDWTKVYQPRPSAVCFPRTVHEVSRLMKLCTEFEVPVVPSGGRTGLAGGAVAQKGEIVLSLKRMNRIYEVNPLAQNLRVEAGAITQAVHEHCAPFGLTWPVDFASKGSSHVGGNIATNAGGVNVIRYGLTRQWVLGLQVVLASGEILELNGALEKNNTGFDLRQLFIGTEGTLGIITEATLKLARLPRDKKVMLFSVSGISDVLAVFQEARRGPFQIHAFEFFTDVCLKRVMQHRGVRAPFREQRGCTVLMEVECSGSQESENLDTWLESLFDKQLIDDGVMAQSPEQATDFWALRESIAESLFATGLPHKNDIALPIAELASFCGSLDQFFSDQYPGWEIANFGHIGDGNLHINVMKPDHLSKELFLQKTKSVDKDLFDLVRRHKGSISAEHGIGLLKKEFLTYSRTASEMALLRSIKRSVDPLGILNPGKIFE